MSKKPAKSGAAKTTAPYLQFGSVCVVPSLHANARFAALVRAAFFELNPKAIAVELPPTLEDSLRQGAARLPYLSVVGFDDFDEEIDQVRRILPITPEDSLIEALRLGMEHNVPVHFVDRDVINHTPPPLAVPDDYLIERLGLATYVEKAKAGLPPTEPGSPDEAREIEMADGLRMLTASGDTVLFVCGLAHLDGVMRHYELGTPRLPGAVTQREQMLYSLAPESLNEVLGGMGYGAFAHELARKGLKPKAFPQLLPPPLAQGGERDVAIDASRETLKVLLETLSNTKTGVYSPPDDYDLLGEMASLASILYVREWNERPSPLRQQTLLRYARNLALVEHFLTPSRFQFLLAARSTVNDDFAFQLFRLVDLYPFHEEDSELPELKIEGEHGEAEGEELILRLRTPPSLRQTHREEQMEFDAPPEESEDGAWEERWEMGDHHVSHLPQDDRLEHFFTYVRNKARKIIADQQSRSHEMQASLMDGLDLRETLRNLPMGKIFVREHLPAVGDVGPVVAIFHQPGEEDQYPHQQMWYAEHSEQSDLALYSTQPGLKFDGPGISRCQYGGVLSLFPPTGRASVWGNPRYQGGGSRAEALLKAAIDLSRKPVVAYVAPQGPSAETLALAAARGIHIMYIPLDTLSADWIKRVRSFHVLADRNVRPLAGFFVN